MNNRPNGKSALVRRLVLSFLTLAVTAICATASEAADWPNWRGPNSNGSVETGQYPVKWDVSAVQWKVELPGKGTSTPIVHNNRIYLTVPADGRDALLAFDFSGKLIWQTHLGAATPPKHRQLASSCNASPVTDGESIFVYFKSGTFASISLDGAIRWQTNLVERFGPDQLFWDQGSSPIVTDKDVVMARLHSGDSWIAGFDKRTGRIRWQQSRNYKAPNENDNGYTTPVAFQHQGKPALLIWAADHLTAHDAANGNLLWSCGNFNPDANSLWPAIATPVIVGNIAVIPVGRDDRNQARLHGIKLDGTGDVTGTHRLWKRDDVGVFVSSPIAYKGRVYLLRHRGEVVCIDPATGQTLWKDAFPKTSASYYSSPVIANGTLFAAREDGLIFAARISDKFDLLGENPMGEQTIACPVPAANRLFIRTSAHLFCVSNSL